MMATYLIQFVIYIFAVGCTLAADYALDSTYCMRNTGSTFQTINLGHEQSAMVTYDGIRTFGDDCSINFQGGSGDLLDDYTLCVEPVSFNITCSVVKMHYFEFISITTSPTKTFTCTDQPERYCTQKRNLLISVDAGSPTSSEISLKITSINNDISGVPGLKSTLFPLLVAGFFFISKKLL